MAAYEQRDMSGSLWKNDRKTTDAQPNATGSALIGGVDYWVSAWTKTDKNGNKWQSLAFTRKDEKAALTSPPEKQGAIPGLDEDIPFINIGRGIGGHAI